MSRPSERVEPGPTGPDRPARLRVRDAHEVSRNDLEEHLPERDRLLNVLTTYSGATLVGLSAIRVNPGDVRAGVGTSLIDLASAAGGRVSRRCAG